MKKLSDFCNVYSGYAFKEFNDSKNGNPVLKIGNININGTINLENCQYSNEVVNEKYISQRNDLYIALSGATTGKVGIMNSDEKFYINQRVGIIRCKNNNIPVEYLKHYLISKTNKILSDASGCAQPNISPKMLENYPIKDLEIHQMSEIADRLKKITDLIQKNKTLIKKYDELVKSQFIEMFGDVENNKYNWTKKLFGSVVSISRGASPRPIENYITNSDDGVNWIKIGDVDENSLYIEKTLQKITKLGAEKSKQVKCGDFILSNSMSYGRPYILKIDGCVHDGWLIISSYDKYFDKYFLYYLLRSDSVNKQFRAKATGGVVNNLNSDKVKSTTIFIPPIELQNQFADFVKHIDKLKFTIKQSVEKLELCYKSLMKQYFE